MNMRLRRIVFPNILKGDVIDTTPFFNEAEAEEFRDDCNRTDDEIGFGNSFEVIPLGG